MSTSRYRVALSLVAVASLVLAACTGRGEQATENEPGTLTFWSWVPGIEKAVDLWNREHPDVKVRFTRITGGAEGSTKLRAAIKAGNAPDLAQVEFQQLTSFLVEGALAEISKFADRAKDQFVDWTWAQVSLGGGVYAIPQDTGPVALVYNKQVFDEFAISLPTTWDQFRAAAEKLHAADPSRYLTTFSQDDGWFPMLAWQNGAKWFGTSGDSWQVDIAGPKSRQVAGYWQDLVSRDLVKVDPGFNPAWFKQLDTGKVASWITAAWGPLLLSTNLNESKGDWAVAPLPQWTAGAAASGNWGGSTTAVLKGSEHIEQAVDFAIWLNSDPGSLELLIQGGGLFPAATAGMELPVLAQPDPFFGGQRIFDVFRQAAGAIDTSWTWGPAMGETYTAIEDGITKAAERGTSFAAVLDAAQKRTVDALVRRGLQVAGS